MDKKVVNITSRSKEAIKLTLEYFDIAEIEEYICTGYGSLVDVPEMFFIGGIDGNNGTSVLIPFTRIKKMHLSEITI